MRRASRLFGRVLARPSDRCGRAWPWWIVAMVSAAIAVAVLAALSYRNRLRSPRQNAFPGSFDYSLDDYRHVPEEAAAYRLIAQWEVGWTQPSALFVGGDDAVWVGGEGGVERYSPRGDREQTTAIPGPIRCLAVADIPRSGGEPRKTILCASGSEVTLWDESGKPLGRWNSFGDKALITSLAVAEDGVFVADAGNRVVHHVDFQGEFIGQLAQRDRDRGILGLVVPSPYLDVAWGSDGQLRVVNPGAHRVEYYRPSGDLEFFWGKAGLGKDGFCGCCNPAHIALLPDGSTVTLEKGLLRIKVFSPQGEFRGWVAGPNFFGDTGSLSTETREDERTPVPDLAADSRGRIVVLDSGRRKVFVFEPKTADDAAASERNETAEDAGGAASEEAAP